MLRFNTTLNKSQNDDETKRVFFRFWKDYTRQQIEKKQKAEQRAIERKHHIREHAFLNMGQIVLISLFFSIVYYNYLMLSNYLTFM